jgi:hypothetical protein
VENYQNLEKIGIPDVWLSLPNRRESDIYVLTEIWE